MDVTGEPPLPSPGAAIVILTGAGVSAESGLSTFRDPDGIWAQHDIDEVATPEAFRRNPGLVHRFYNDRRRHLLLQSVRPNKAHRALAELGRSWPGAVTLITQNIDDLHERADGPAPIHMHGELLKVRCVRSGRVFECREPITPSTPCRCCHLRGALRPHVVWFGEMPFDLERIERALSGCNLFLSIGTSGEVYPAAGFAARAKRNRKAHAVELNLEPAGSSAVFDERIRGPATVVVPRYVEKLLGRAIP